jgi:hypothetical protein
MLDVYAPSMPSIRETGYAIDWRVVDIVAHPEDLSSIIDVGSLNRTYLSPSTYA